ncbi:MAG: tail fiber domain-containing protein [Dyadobacter fermentans]
MRVISFFFLMLSFSAFAQTPQGFSFQGVARDENGKVVASQSVGLRFTIHKTSANGPIQYQETQISQTNSGGLFIVSIGAGTPVSGVFSDINWSNAEFFLQLELDPAGGDAYLDAGTSQLLSVPYSLHSREAMSWINGDPVVQKGILHQGATLAASSGTGPRLIWYPRLGAFRAGEVTNDAWNASEFGTSSIGLGRNTRALGSGSIAIGSGSESLQSESVAIGYKVTSKKYFSVTLGGYNNDDGFPSNLIDANDRIFQLGNGTSDNNRSNAITVLRSGNVGIGVLYPQYNFDVAKRMRIKHQAGSTAGLFLDGSKTDDYQKGPAAFMGMVNDDQVGFFIGDMWRFYVHANGNATLTGNLTQNSDRRLKSDLATLQGSRHKILGLSGYHYRWASEKRSRALQTGFVAQEVEAVLPELVETDAQGYKSVNYIGLIPHLVEAFKELQNDYNTMKAANEALQSRVRAQENAQP